MWETKGKWNQIDIQLRILEIEGEYMIELLAPQTESWTERLVSAVRYLFNRQRIILFLMPVERRDISKLFAYGSEKQDR